MFASVKKRVARLALRWVLPAFLDHPDAFHSILGRAIQLQLGKLTEDAFREELDEFYARLIRNRLLEQIDFGNKCRRLETGKGYKIGITHLPEGPECRSWPGLGMIWRRRFALLHHLGIRSDVLILRQGEQVPPHGHYRIVSGFYVLEGQVGIRHYDRVREVGDKLAVRQALARSMGPGGYTTNSEYFQNIHWLVGLAPRSYLFRVTVSGTPVWAFNGHKEIGDRVYIDPTGQPDEHGLILAPYIGEGQAKKLSFPPIDYPANESCAAPCGAVGHKH